MCSDKETRSAGRRYLEKINEEKKNGKKNLCEEKGRIKINIKAKTMKIENDG